MLDFRTLASSSDGCSYHVTCGSHLSLLIDAGISFAQIQRELDFKVSELAGVLISHAHGDHSKAIPALLKAGVDVFASVEAWRELDPDGRMLGHRSRCASAQSELSVGPWRILPFDAVHDSPGTLGFMVAAPDDQGKLLYLTDTAYSKFRFEGLTHIAIEANFSQEKIRHNTLAGSIDRSRHSRTSHNHMSIERLEGFFEAMKKDGLLTAVEEIHLLHLSDENSDEVDFQRRIARLTGKPVYVAAKQGARA